MTAIVRDPRTSQPSLRDHRTSGPTVRDHRTSGPAVRDHRTGPAAVKDAFVPAPPARTGITGGPNPAAYGDLKNPTNRAKFEMASLRHELQLKGKSTDGLPDPSKFGDLTHPTHAAKFEAAVAQFKNGGVGRPDPSKYGDLTNPNHFAKYETDKLAFELKQNGKSVEGMPNPKDFGDLTNPHHLAKFQLALMDFVKTAKPAAQSTQSAASTSPSSSPSPAAAHSGGIPDPSKFGDLTKPENMKAYQEAQLAYQQVMNRLNEMFQMLSNIEKSRSDTAKAIAGNIR